MLNQRPGQMPMVERGVEDTEPGGSIVFIVGCPRSGTTWLQRLLATHPNVKTGQESHAFGYIVPQLRLWQRQLDSASEGRGGVGLPCYMTDQEFNSLLRSYTIKLLAPMINKLNDGDIFIEKTPSHALVLTDIERLLPRSKFIHILRDPRDVCASLLAANKGWGKRWAPGSAKDAALMWVSHVQAATAAGRQMPTNQYCEVRYEDLQHSPVTTLESLSQFLNLQWSLDDIERAIEANSADLVRRGGGTKIPLSGEVGNRMGRTVKEPEGFIRRATPGAWKTDLSLLAKLQVWRVTGHFMKEFGYS